MIQMFTKKRNKKGFTLIELIVVIAILGILVAIAIPRFGGARDAANEGAVKAALKNIDSAVEMYAAQHNVADITTVTTDNAKTILTQWPDGSPAAGYAYTVVAGKATLSTKPASYTGITTLP